MNFFELRSGTTLSGEPIKAFKIDDKSVRNNIVYLIAGVHGDEIEGVYVLQQLYEWLQDADDIVPSVIVIPILNIDGYRAGTRCNGRGVDLNRNLPTKSWTAQHDDKKNYPGTGPASEPENEFLMKLLNKYKPQLIISFHSWKPLLNYNGDCMDVAKYLKSYNGYPIAGDVGYPTPGSLGELGPEMFNAGVLTFELPPLSNTLTLKEIWAENKEGLQRLLTSSDFFKKKP